MVFSGNEAGNAGGAIFVADASSSMEIASGAVFKSNSAKLGGAIYNKGNLGTLDGVTFEDNTAETNGGAILNSNGGTIASITNSIFKNNTSTNGGGAAIYNKGGEIAEISNTVFEGNIAEKETAAPFLTVARQQPTSHLTMSSLSATRRQTAAAELSPPAVSLILPTPRLRTIPHQQAAAQLTLTERLN